MTELRALKPCPFCGGTVRIEQPAGADGDDWWGVVCRNTTNLGGTCAIEQRPSRTKKAATTRWNRRTPDAAEQALSAPPQGDGPVAVPAVTDDFVNRLSSAIAEEYGGGWELAETIVVRAMRPNEIAALSPAPAAPAAVPAWQTMDSAPMDGTEILACWDAPTPEYRARGVVFWEGNNWLTSPGHWQKKPTHWMPLPAAPLPSQPADGGGA